jgi:hypothetical protein
LKAARQDNRKTLTQRDALLERNERLLGFFPCRNDFQGLKYSQIISESHHHTRRLGYARVSTCGLTLDAHLEPLMAERCAKVCRREASGVKTDPASFRGC